jgi:hypothetical protein
MTLPQLTTFQWELLQHIRRLSANPGPVSSVLWSLAQDGWVQVREPEAVAVCQELARMGYLEFLEAIIDRVTYKLVRPSRRVSGR